MSQRNSHVVLRSFLFTPGNHERRVEKVFVSGADAAILDLEDAVAIAEKPATRARVVEALGRLRPCLGYVRVNAWDTQWCYRDLVETVGPWLDGVVLPKVESAEAVQTVDWLLRGLEREAGMAEGSVDLMPIIETAAGVEHISEICGAGTRVRRVSFGGGDYTLDLDLEWSVAETALAHARARLAHASRVAGMEPPIDTVVIHIRDHERMQASAEHGREMGFQGKLCIHPDQVPIANRVFSPDAAAIEHARRVIDAFREAEASGSASIQLDGYFIDYPIVYKAQRILAIADAIAASGGGR